MKLYHNWKFLFFLVMAIAMITDVFGEGLMVVGVLLGWLLGIATTVQWDIEAKNIKRKETKQDHEVPEEKRKR